MAVIIPVFPRHSHAVESYSQVDPNSWLGISIMVLAILPALWFFYAILSTVLELWLEERRQTKLEKLNAELSKENKV